MIIITADGPRNIGLALLTPYTTPRAIIDAERAWRNAWNSGAQDFNRLVETAQERYGRMMDVKPLKFIPADSTKIPE
jgi:hypothetical protein